jgi:hypothetical protein
MIRLTETREIAPYPWVHSGRTQSAGSLWQFREPIRVERRHRRARLWRRRLLFAQNERALKQHARDLFCRSYVSRDLAVERSFKLHREIISAKDRCVPFGMPFGRYDCGNRSPSTLQEPL